MQNGELALTTGVVSHPVGWPASPTFRRSSETAEPEFRTEQAVPVLGVSLPSPCQFTRGTRGGRAALVIAVEWIDQSAFAPDLRNVGPCPSSGLHRERTRSSGHD